MSESTIHIKLKLNFPVILIAVVLLHALVMMSYKAFPDIASIIAAHNASSTNDIAPLKIQDIRRVGARDSKIQNSTYLSKSANPFDQISKNKAGNAQNSSKSNVAPKPSLSLSNLGAGKTAPAQAAQMAKPQGPMARPGTRPGVMPERPKAINAISLKGGQIQEFARSQGANSVASSASELSGDPRTRSLSNSDILVNLEVPEGVNPDELNEYEMMFYGFQRRTAIGYVNSFYKHLDKFQRENPHMQFPMTDTKQVMTGRLTYDEKGNIKQIKMIRWTNVDRLQGFFEEVLKDMDTLHNPPKPLWSKSGEFSIFFSLVING